MTNPSTSDIPANADARRAIRQRLESLQRAGVTQIGLIPEPTPLSELETAEAEPTQIESETPTTSRVGSNELDSTAPPVTAESPAVKATPVAATPTANSAATAIGSGKKTDKETDGDQVAALQVLADEVAACTLCKELCSTRQQTVFGVGDPQSRLMFFGEAPGADEDRLGEPFVGAAGQLLTKIIGAMGLRREDVYILNTLKCRPPGNRNPLPEEVTNCRPFFDRQLEIIQPEFIVCLGAVSAQNLLETSLGIGKLRGRFHDWKGAKVIATYHPAYLLRNASAKKMVWEDMKMLMAEMGLEIP